MAGLDKNTYQNLDTANEGLKAALEKAREIFKTPMPDSRCYADGLPYKERYYQLSHPLESILSNAIHKAPHIIGGVQLTFESNVRTEIQRLLEDIESGSAFEESVRLEASQRRLTLPLPFECVTTRNTHGSQVRDDLRRSCITVSTYAPDYIPHRGLQIFTSLFGSQVAIPLEQIHDIQFSDFNATIFSPLYDVGNSLPPHQLNPFTYYMRLQGFLTVQADDLPPKPALTMEQDAVAKSWMINPLISSPTDERRRMIVYPEGPRMMQMDQPLINDKRQMHENMLRQFLLHEQRIDHEALSDHLEKLDIKRSQFLREHGFEAYLELEDKFRSDWYIAKELAVGKTEIVKYLSQNFTLNWR